MLRTKDNNRSIDISTAIIYYSKHHGNTKKLIDAIAADHASAIGDFLIAMVLTRTLTGKLPDEKFCTALDFTVPLEFQPVKEDTSEEEIILAPETVSLIRENVQKVFGNKV